MALSESLFEPFVAGNQKASLASLCSSAHWDLPCLGSFSCLTHQTHRRAPLALIIFCRLAHEALKGAPWVGSYSVVWCARRLMGQPLYCLVVDAGVQAEWGYSDGSVPSLDSAVSACFHGCLAFLHRHFPPQSPPSHPLSPSLCSQQQPSPWDCSTNPKFQLPATAAFRGPVFFSGLSMAEARTLWFSFRLGCHGSAVSLSALNVSPLTHTIALMWESDPFFSSPTHWVQF